MSRAMDNASGVTVNPWWNEIVSVSARVHAWFDFEAAGDAVRKLAALHAIVQIAQGERSRPAISLMENTGKAVSALEPFREGRVSLKVGPDAWDVDLSVGH